MAGSGTVVFFLIVGLAIYSLHTSLIQPKVHLEFSGLKDTYKAGERINFNVSVIGEGCDYPQYVMIQSLQNGSTVWIFNGTGLNAAISCPHIGGGGKMTYDTAQGVWNMHWINSPIVINQTGMYRAVAGFYDQDKIQRDFRIIDVKMG